MNFQKRKKKKAKLIVLSCTYDIQMSLNKTQKIKIKSGKTKNSKGKYKNGKYEIFEK